MIADQKNTTSKKSEGVSGTNIIGRINMGKFRNNQNKFEYRVQ